MANIRFNPWSEEYKRPFGAIKAGQTAGFMIEVYDAYVKSVELESELVILEASKSQLQANNDGLIDSLNKASDTAQKNKVDYETKMKEYEAKVKETKSTIKYVEVKSNECEDIKRILDDVRNNGY